VNWRLHLYHLTIHVENQQYQNGRDLSGLSSRQQPSRGR